MVSRDTLLSVIDPDPDQPRKVFDAVGLAELAESIAANGLAVPILLRPAASGRYLIVHGERRWRAVQRLGWQSIPAEVRELTPDDAHWLSLVENVQRADLSPVEEARAYQARLAQGLTQAQLARRVGKDRSYIAQKLRLLTLPASVLLFLERRLLSEGHARQLLKVRQWIGADLTHAFEWLRKPPVQDRSHIHDAADALVDEGCAHGLIIPCWHLTAHRLAVEAVEERQSVAQLAAMLEDFYLDLCLAAWLLDSWRPVFAQEPRPPSPIWSDEQFRCWLYLLDLLKTAGWLFLVMAGALPDAVWREVHARVDAYDPSLRASGR